MDALRKLAADRAAGVTAEALMALGRIATPEAVETLRQALKSTEVQDRLAAVDACLTCADALVAKEKRAEAIALLDQARLADVPEYARAAATHSAILARQAGDLSLFREELKAESPVLFAAAIRAAHRLSGPEVTVAMLAELDQLPQARQTVVFGALVERHDAAALPALQKTATAGSKSARLTALAMLGQLGDASSTGLLIDTALGGDADLAKAARESLAKTKMSGLDAALASRLERAAPKEKVALLDVLGRRGDVSSKQIVLKLTNDPDSEVRLAAIRASGNFASTDDLTSFIERLHAAKTPEETAAVQQALRTACGRSPDPDACTRKLRDCMTAGSLPDQCFLLELMGQAGGREALAIVAAHARGTQPELQDAATKTLGKWMSVDAAPVLLDLVKTIGDPKLKIRCLRGYLRIARQLNMPAAQRLAMSKTAMQLAERDEEKKLAAEVADIAKKSGTLKGTKAGGRKGKAARANAIKKEGDAPNGDKDDTPKVSEDKRAKRKARRLKAAEDKASNDKTGEVKPATETASEEKTPAKGVSLFDGHTFDGWEGDTAKTFRIEDGAVVGGTLKERVPHNAFLCTTKSYTNFVLRAECKLVGPTSNGGIQFRTQRIPNNNEVSGFQADMSAGANGGYWGCLYDESRRKKVLARPARAVIMKALKPNDWNLYEIRCEGPRIRLSLNGVQTVDYTETDPKIATAGIIAVQIHASKKPSETWYRNITIEELP